MFKVNNRNTRTRCEICSKLTIATPERCHRILWNTFRWVIAEVLCHGFNFVNVRIVVKVMFFGTYFSLSNSTRRFSFVESLLQDFVISFLTLTYIRLDE